MMRHECHAEGCSVPVPPSLLMCPRHWKLLPPDLRAAVYEHYRPGQERDKRPSIDYLDVMQRAINYVARLEGQHERALPSELIAKLGGEHDA